MIAEEEIIVGIHEQHILGFHIVGQKDGFVTLKASFTNHAHTGSVKHVAIAGDHLVSSGTDEYLRIFDLRDRVEVGTLSPHEGLITSLTFHKDYLFTSADDGKIFVFHKQKWQEEKMLKGHMAGIKGFSVHPSGKLALSISTDKKMLTWELSKGKKAYITALRNVPDSICWSPSGSEYLISSDSLLDIYDVKTGNVQHSVDFKERIHSLLFISNEVVLIAGEGKNICIFNTKEGKEINQWKAHDNRIKSLARLEDNGDLVRVASASSDGFIKIWGLRISSLASEPKLLGKLDTSCRIICMAVRLPSVSALDKAPIGKKTTVESHPPPEIAAASFAVIKTGKKKKNQRKDSIKSEEEESTSSLGQDGESRDFTEQQRVSHAKKAKKRKSKSKDATKQLGFEVLNVETDELSPKRPHLATPSRKTKDEMNESGFEILDLKDLKRGAKQRRQQSSSSSSTRAELDFEVVDLATLKLNETNVDQEGRKLGFEVVNLESLKLDMLKHRRKRLKS